MPDLEAKTLNVFDFGGTVRGQDGYTVEFWMDDSLRSWWSIVRWNLHYRHWRDLRANAVDLFSKVIWRKLWRR